MQNWTYVQIGLNRFFNVYILALGHIIALGLDASTKLSQHPKLPVGLFLGGVVSYPMLRMTHPPRNFFVLSLFCVYACLYG
jgi:hypothetical protein